MPNILKGVEYRSPNDPFKTMVYSTSGFLDWADVPDNMYIFNPGTEFRIKTKQTVNTTQGTEHKVWTNHDNLMSYLAEQVKAGRKVEVVPTTVPLYDPVQQKLQYAVGSPNENDGWSPWEFVTDFNKLSNFKALRFRQRPDHRYVVRFAGSGNTMTQSEMFFEDTNKLSDYLHRMVTEGRFGFRVDAVPYA